MSDRLSDDVESPLMPPVTVNNTLPDEPWAKRVIFRTEVGSTAWGTGIKGTEDHDEIAVIWVPVRHLAGLMPHPETIRYRPGRSEGERSQPGDFDLVVYTARKYASLLVKGNPSILAALFGPSVQDSALAKTLKGLAWTFASQSCLKAYIGYQTAQFERFRGVRGGRHTNRPELIEQYGYDTKYAMHMIRLGWQGIEFLTTGTIQAPIEPKQRQELLDIRTGKYTFEEIHELGRQVQSDLRAIDPNGLPSNDAAALATADQWLAEVYNWFEFGALDRRWG